MSQEISAVRVTGVWVCQGHLYEVVVGTAEVTLIRGFPPIRVPALQFLEPAGPNRKVQHGVYGCFPGNDPSVFSPIQQCGCHDWPDSIHISEVSILN